MTSPVGDTAPATRTPHVVRSRAELARAVNERAEVGDVHLVPTMGALHEGHATLIRTARGEARPDDVVVVSVFVNPLQFAPGEDLDRYPRTFDADLQVCGREGADVVFAPDVDEVYPGGEPQVTVHPGPLGELLEGASRPTHFRGVLTVVAKLLGLVRPDRLYLGEKDYQQLVLVRRMVEDLCLGVDVVGVPTVREPDGLALSSRNHYLDPTQRRAAQALSGALRAGAAAGADGADSALSAARAAADDLDLDYLALTAPDLGAAPAAGEARLLVAARLGTTRLIDNTALTLGVGDAGPPSTVADPRSS